MSIANVSYVNDPSVWGANSPVTIIWFSGEVIENNKSIVEDPSSINSDPEGAGWFFKIKIKNNSELNSLMSKTDYDKFVAESPS